MYNLKLQKMKKLFIAASLLIGMIAGAIVLSSFSDPKQDSIVENTDVSFSVLSGVPQCVIVGNCTVGLNAMANNKYKVYCVNHNRYRVSVTYTVQGYDNNGNLRRVSGGSISVGPNTSTSGQTAYGPEFTTTCKDLYIDTDNLRIVKCD